MDLDYHQHTGGKQQRKTRYRKLDQPDDILGGFEEEKDGLQMQEESGSRISNQDHQQQSDSETSLFECDPEQQSLENPLANAQIVKLTDNFRLAYKDIKDSQMLRESPLNALTIEKIRVMIKNGRRQVSRQAKVIQNLNEPKSAKSKLKQKRQPKQQLILEEELRQTKRQCIEQPELVQKKDFSLAKQLISSFEFLDSDLQSKILNVVEDHIQQDNQLLRMALKQQVSLHVLSARQMVEQRKLGLLEQLLSTLAPAAAIMLNIQVSLVFPTYTEESGTLSRTLLPFIDKVTDYRFLGPETNFIAGRFLGSLIVHLKDSQIPASVGFINFALQLNPQALKSVITIGGGVLSLQQALLGRGFNEAAVNAMCLYPSKFLWADLFSFWKDKSPEIITQCVEILARMDVLTDPSEQIEQLVAALGLRSLFAKCLLQKDKIKMSIGKLVRILETLANLQSETISTCLMEDSSKWEQIALQSNNMEETKDEKLTSDQVADLYKELTETIPAPVTLDSMIALSKEVSSEVEDYRHNDLQSCIAGVVISHKQDFTVVVSPTGSGKTWIQGLIAKYFCNLGKKVVVVEPNEMLMRQTAEKLALVDYNITVTSISRLYREGPWHEIVILDEYDNIIQQSPYHVEKQGVKGIWQLKGKRVFAFSATSSTSHERLINNCIVRPKVLKFKSEYELIHGSNPITDAVVIQCEDQEKLFSQLQVDLDKQYEIKPVIIILDDDLKNQIIHLAKENKWRYLETQSPNYQSEIRQWDYGMLLLNAEEGRGVDTRFKKAAHVVILAKVQSHHEVQQMIGRSCRTRGVCEGTLYAVGEERPIQVMERLRKNGVISLMDMERLLELLEKKGKDIAVIKTLLSAAESKTRVVSLDDLKGVMEEGVFNRVCKGVIQ